MDKYLCKVRGHVVANKMLFQGPLCNAYGEFCLLFGFFLCRGWRLEEILKYFSEDLSINSFMTEDPVI